MAIYAIAIAIVASLGEILSKYETKVLRDILNVYLVLYLAINGFFAYATYHFLPAIAQFVLKPEYTAWAQGETWGRVFIAAFGYLAIVRAKFITVKDTPIGIDTLYDTFTKYCLRHINIKINNRQDQILSEVFQKFQHLQTYQDALEIRLPNLSAEENAVLTTQRNAILNSNLGPHIKCKRLGELLLRIVGTKEELLKVLSNVP